MTMTSRRVMVGLGLLATTASLLACDLLKKKVGADGADGAAATATDGAAATTADTPTTDGSAGTAATPVSDPAADAANKAKVARYGDEQKLAGEADKLLSGAAARTFPPNGDFIVSLPPGTEVKKIATHDEFVLIGFTNPKDPKESLIGWVTPNAFKAMPDAGPPKTAQCKADSDCKGGARCVLTGPGRSLATCALACASTQPACPSGQVCEGEGAVNGTFFAFCVASRTKPDAGAAVAADAGGGAQVGGGTFKVGEKVSVSWNGSWYPAQVLGVIGTNLYRIHYDGYESKWDETVAASRIKKR